MKPRADFKIAEHIYRTQGLAALREWHSLPFVEVPHVPFMKWCDGSMIDTTAIDRLLWPDADLWTVDVVGRHEGASREVLTVEPVDLEFAQGLAEDYVRRIGVTSIAIKEASWRLRPASEKQIAALKRCGVAVPSTLTAGEASDALTASVAASKGHDPATPKQIAYLARLGVETGEGLTKREAGRLIAGARG